MTLHTYLPQDRLRALARGETLPDRTSGSVLFADISGFTALTEGLRESLGARQGAEELSKQLGVVYTALITEVEKYGGSVIGFAGDAITCWFDDAHGPASPRATACAFALQAVMQAFVAIPLSNGKIVALTLKVAVATGPARRFVVGDPTINYIDALAGATVARTSTAEHLANKGDILLDEATVNILGSALTVKEWRSDTESGERFAVASKSEWHSDLQPILPGTTPPPAANKLRVWMHSAVYEREQTGQESFLTEFRPCVAVFVRFIGIDYDSDLAEKQLDTFLRQTQNIVERYEGTLMDITIGDKGSYAYVNFGALAAHEDDSRRAVKAALELRNKTELQLQMGITQGLMRVGAYGGETRKVFGALGDDVNLAARLMTTAKEDEILLSSHVHKAVQDQFTFEPRSPLPMKGKAEPLPVFAVTGESQKRAVRLQEPNYSLPMVGRVEELRLIEEKLDLAKAGKSQIIGIVAEAGLGKSRLVAEVIRSARRKGYVGYGGACQSDGIHTPYLAWKSIWQAFFDVDPEMSERKLLRNIEGEIEDRAPSRMDAMPLLNVVLDLNIPENDFTKNLEPKIRQSALHALLEDCLKAQAADEPTLIVIEDLHWIDALSHDLLEQLAKALAGHAVCFVLAYRPPQMERLQNLRIEALEQFTRIALSELTTAEAESAVRAKLTQLYPARAGALPAGLVDTLMARAQGNPFYLEELLNYLRDRGIDPSEIGKIELPDSLHTLILSRIDQLSEGEKTTLRVASIVGRSFRAKWLTGYYPELGSFPQVKASLDALSGLDITPLDSPEPELAYLFKHIVTHEVTYESLPFGLRAQLHEQLAHYLENQIAQGALTEAAMLDTLVFHYMRSENRNKQRAYLKKAGAAAFDVSAFEAVLEYQMHLLELTPEDDPALSALALQLAEAQYRLGDITAARETIQRSQVAATTAADRATALSLLGEITNGVGDYTDAQTILSQAVPLARASGDALALCRTLMALGTVLFNMGNLDDARAALEEGLQLARNTGDMNRELIALNRLGLVYLQKDTAIAEQYFVQVYEKAVATGNRLLEMTALGNLGIVADERNDFVTQHDSYEKALVIAREIGSKPSITLGSINLAYSNIKLGRLSAAREKLQQGLTMGLDLGIHPIVVSAVLNYAELYYAEGQTERALALFGLSRLQPMWNSDLQRGIEGTLVRWGLDPGVVEAGMAKGAELDWGETVKELLKG